MDYPNLTAPFPFMGTNRQVGNPWFTVANQFVPRNLHDVIRWARYISIQSPTTSEVIRKLATYPITDFIVDTEQPSVKKRYEEVFASFKLKEILQDIGFEFFTIGNVFASIYFPIHRECVCPSCNTSWNLRKTPWIKFKQYKFTGTCPQCNYTGAFPHKDTKSTDINDMNLIKWTPEHITVNHNPITGESEYFYTIPNTIKSKIQRGDRIFVDTLPWAFIEAVKNNQDFKFDRGSLYHLKNISSGGTVEGISVPPLLSLFSLVFYQATLRKANEAIALEYLSPLRVVFPQAQTANSDPVVSMSMRNFRGHMEDAFRRHKNDPNHLVIAPVPVGYSALGGDGKALLVSQEIAQAEETVLLSLGVSKELLSGQTNWESTSVGLRMMENTLFSYSSRIEEFIGWVMAKVSSYLMMERVKVTLVPFKLLDDDNFKQLLQALVSVGDVSKRTLFEEWGLDYHEERKRLQEEAALTASAAIETQYAVEQAQFVAAKGSGPKPEEDDGYVNLITQASTIADQLVTMGPNEVNSFMSKLKVENYGLYVMVNVVLEQYRNSAGQGTPETNAPVGPQDPNQAENKDQGQNQGQNKGQNRSKLSGQGGGQKSDNEDDKSKSSGPDKSKSNNPPPKGQGGPKGPSSQKAGPNKNNK